MNIDQLLKSVSKPGRYTGGEWGQTIKDKQDIKCRWAFCFPDTYEIGMSNLGVRILYDALNREDNIWCERCFAPWPDMGNLMREKDISLYALESGDALRDFDFVGFTLQYELSYTNVLYMLDLAKIPYYAEDRGEEYPFVYGGGLYAGMINGYKKAKEMFEKSKNQFFRMSQPIPAYTATTLFIC